MTDWNKVASYEKAIKERYGEEALFNPKEELTPEDYQKYREEAKEFYDKILRAQNKREKIDRGGYRVSKRLIKRELPSRTCPVCKNYSFNTRDDIYMKRYGCCFGCYIDHVEGREEDWPERKRELIVEEV